MFILGKMRVYVCAQVYSSAAVFKEIGLLIDRVDGWLFGYFTRVRAASWQEKKKKPRAQDLKSQKKFVTQPLISTSLITQAIYSEPLVKLILADMVTFSTIQGEKIQMYICTADNNYVY